MSVKATSKLFPPTYDQDTTFSLTFDLPRELSGVPLSYVKHQCSVCEAYFLQEENFCPVCHPDRYFQEKSATHFNFFRIEKDTGPPPPPQVVFLLIDLDIELDVILSFVDKLKKEISGHNRLRETMFYIALIGQNVFFCQHRPGNLHFLGIECITDIRTCVSPLVVYIEFLSSAIKYAKKYLFSSDDKCKPLNSLFSYLKKEKVLTDIQDVIYLFNKHSINTSNFNFMISPPPRWHFIQMPSQTSPSSTTISDSNSDLNSASTSSSNPNFNPNSNPNSDPNSDPNSNPNSNPNIISNSASMPTSSLSNSSFNSMSQGQSTDNWNNFPSLEFAARVKGSFSQQTIINDDTLRHFDSCIYPNTILAPKLFIFLSEGLSIKDFCGPLKNVNQKRVNKQQVCTANLDFYSKQIPIIMILKATKDAYSKIANFSVQLAFQFFSGQVIVLNEVWRKADDITQWVQSISIPYFFAYVHEQKKNYDYLKKNFSFSLPWSIPQRKYKINGAANNKVIEDFKQKMDSLDKLIYILFSTNKYFTESQKIHFFLLFFYGSIEFFEALNDALLAMSSHTFVISLPPFLIIKENMREQFETSSVVYSKIVGPTYLFFGNKKFNSLSRKIASMLSASNLNC